MRHRKNHRHLSRTSSHRKAMFRNMVTSLLDLERIQTTDAKAKELRGIVERLITTAKQGARYAAPAEAATQPAAPQRLQAKALHKRRRAARKIQDHYVLQKLFSDIQARYQDRPGGYTRVIKLGARTGDAAPMSIVELVDRRAAVAAPVEGDDAE